MWPFKSINPPRCLDCLSCVKFGDNSPSYFCRRYIAEYDPVTGETNRIEITMNARDLRHQPGDCGPKGRFFRPRGNVPMLQEHDAISSTPVFTSTLRVP